MAKPTYLALRVRGSSMWPLFRRGDYLLVNRQNDCHPGAIIAFRQRNVTITHRVWRKISSYCGTVFYTKGDSSFRRDPLVRSSRVLGVVVARIRDGKYCGTNNFWWRCIGVLAAWIIPTIARIYQALRRSLTLAVPISAPKGRFSKLSLLPRHEYLF